MGYLLDTSALSAYLTPGHKHHHSTSLIINDLPAGVVKTVSIVSVAEIDYGIKFAELAGSTRLEEYRKQLEIVRQYSRLDITHHTSEAYSELKAALARHSIRKPGKKMAKWIEDWVANGSGKKLHIDENDLWIAAQAKERDLTIIACDNDMRVFENADSDIRVLLTNT